MEENRILLLAVGDSDNRNKQQTTTLVVVGLRKVAVGDAAILDARIVDREAVAQRVEATVRVVDVDVRALQVAHAVGIGRELVAAVEDSIGNAIVLEWCCLASMTLVLNIAFVTCAG
jgi:hypothetical protein